MPVDTAATDPAILIYTSGTTGAPKGALLPHAALIGNLTGFVASQNWFPQEHDVFWSPADWAWTGGLMDALLPTLYFGKPIVGYRGRFSAETTFHLLEKYAITNTFLFPTALKAMMKAAGTEVVDVDMAEARGLHVELGAVQADVVAEELCLDGRDPRVTRQLGEEGKMLVRCLDAPHPRLLGRM